MEKALAADLERVASSSDTVGLTVSILNGHDIALRMPLDALVSDLRARVAHDMGSKNDARLFFSGRESELTEGALDAAVASAVFSLS